MTHSFTPAAILFYSILFDAFFSILFDDLNDVLTTDAIVQGSISNAQYDAESNHGADDLQSGCWDIMGLWLNEYFLYVYHQAWF